MYRECYLLHEAFPALPPPIPCLVLVRCLSNSTHPYLNQAAGLGTSVLVCPPICLSDWSVAMQLPRGAYLWSLNQRPGVEWWVVRGSSGDMKSPGSGREGGERAGQGAAPDRQGLREASATVCGQRSCSMNPLFTCFLVRVFPVLSLI